MVFGIFDRPAAFRNQDYDELRKETQSSGKLFDDPEFPAVSSSVFHTGRQMSIEWKRPKEICDDPKLFVEGLSSHDVSQGELGNCWFVAACSCLAIHQEIWQKVIPNFKDQEWSDEEPDRYAGIFHFQFWRYGEWVDVVIDDRLPTRNNKLIFIHSHSKNEFWSALLEKAYAKLFGSYEALDGGELAEALEDFTGGVAEPFDLRAGNYCGDADKKEELYNEIKKNWENKALAAAAIPAKSADDMEKKTDNGLVMGHAYGITAVKRIAIEGTGIFNLFNRDKLHMIRLRNPWGGTEWTGPFSDDSEEWKRIDKNDRAKIGLTFEDDGEFWMTLEDFVANFTFMAICRVVNTSFFSFEKTWKEVSLHSEWQVPHRSGGCMNNKSTCLQNPQFLFDIEEKHEEVMICLSQKTTRTKKHELDKETIGFSVLKVEDNRRYRVHEVSESVKTSEFKNSRSIFLRHKFQKGRYVLLACTFDAGRKANFMIRFYSGENIEATELEKEKPETEFCSSMLSCYWRFRYPQIVTRVRVVKAMNLEMQDNVGGADPYCIISCEHEKVYSSRIKNTTCPEWDYEAIFYRKDPTHHHIKINVWNKNLVKDEHLGRAVVQASAEKKGKLTTLDLTGRKGHKNESQPGKLYVEITTSHTLTDL